jgi:SAM-dependent methyltransferase
VTEQLWANATAYERYVGRWSRRVAVEFLSWLDAPTGGRWLDVGSGTGALATTVLAAADPDSVVGVDPSEAYVEYARAAVDDPRARFAVGSAAQLPLPDASVDVAVSGLVFNFVPDAAAALAEVRRVLVPGGRIGLYVWDYAEGMRFMRVFWDVASELDPAAAERDEGPRFPLCRPEALRDLFVQGGLSDVDVTPIDVPTRFTDFEDYWNPFLGGQGPGGSYVVSLPESRRDELREALRSRLTSDVDGSIPLTARAWAVRGVSGSAD